RNLSLSECVRTAVEHNFDVKIEEKGVDIARHQLGGFYGAYDPVLAAGLNHGHSLDPDRTTTSTDGFDANLAGLLPSGLTYELGTLGGSFSDSSGINPGT